MTGRPEGASRPRLTPAQWLVCAVAAMGFAFDIYELLMLPLMVRPALMELGGVRPGTPEFAFWFGVLFYVPAILGGVFGLLGGYLTDRLGRKRVLIWSILVYACSAFLGGFSTSLGMLLACRSLVFIGVCVEFVAAVAWLAETFPDPRQREGVLGATQAFSSVGGLLAAMASTLAAAWASGQELALLPGLVLPAVPLPPIRLPDFLGFLGQVANPHADWRYTLMSGIIPAIPLMLVRPFLPESPPWRRRREAGTLKRPSIAALFAPELRRTTILATLMFTASFGAAFGAMNQLPQIVPGLPEVRADVQKAVAAKRQEGEGVSEVGLRGAAAAIEQLHTSQVVKIQEVGGLCGRTALAVLAVWVAARRRLLRIFVVPGLAAMPWVFGWAGVTSLGQLEAGAFLAGFFTVAQFSFWGNYLPRAFPLHLRGTGESFAANVGGRMIGTCFAALTQWIAYLLPLEAAHPTRVAYVAGAVALCCYLFNFIASFWLPEPENSLAS